MENHYIQDRAQRKPIRVIVPNVDEVWYPYNFTELWMFGYQIPLETRIIKVATLPKDNRNELSILDRIVIVYTTRYVRYDHLTEIETPISINEKNTLREFLKLWYSKRQEYMDNV